MFTSKVYLNKHPVYINFGVVWSKWLFELICEHVCKPIYPHGIKKWLYYSGDIFPKKAYYVHFCRKIVW